MPVKRDGKAVVAKRWMPLGDYRTAMAREWANHWVALSRYANSSEDHDNGARLNGAAAGCFVADSDDVFHDLPLLKESNYFTFKNLFT